MGDFKTRAGTCSSLRWFFSLQSSPEMKTPTCKNDLNLHFLVSHGELYFTLHSPCPYLKVKITTQLPLHIWTDFFSFSQDFWNHFNSCVVLFHPSFSASPLQRCSHVVHSAGFFFFSVRLENGSHRTIDWSSLHHSSGGSACAS